MLLKKPGPGRFRQLPELRKGLGVTFYEDDILGFLSIVF
jgi:hypothetical protein